ncbi:ADP-ribosylglycohydrolase family protein [Megamonas funiformis]|uniref:ADP-ribosylglycohydrolase family protein n=1 Tax=Megamonas funiformis TaxID=437897 RepID=UPI003F7D4E2F
MEKTNKIKGALYGAIIGDALGAPLEFMPQEQIKSQFGKITEMIGGGWLQVQPGEGTDETALLLATAYGIMKNPENPFAEIGKNFIKWAISRPKDISDTTLRSIDKTMSKGHGKHLIPKARWQESAGQVDLFSNRGSVDNGAILNTLYPALYYTDEFNAVTTALDITNMTHVNTQSDNACRIYAQLIFRILNNNITKDDMDKMIDNTMYYDYKNEEIQPTASAYDSIIAMLHAFMPTDNFEAAVLTAINFGGDSDTIGAITGGLAGCYYGYDNIPTRFIEAIPSDIKKMLDTIIEAIPN